MLVILIMLCSATKKETVMRVHTELEANAIASS
jgi:hypothetical protein